MVRVGPNLAEQCLFLIFKPHQQPRYTERTASCTRCLRDIETKHMQLRALSGGETGPIELAQAQDVDAPLFRISVRQQASVTEEVEATSHIMLMGTAEAGVVGGTSRTRRSWADLHI